MSAAQSSEETPGETGGPPPYDPAAVGRVAKRVQIISVELLGAYFERIDDAPLPSDSVPEAPPSILIGGVEWEQAPDKATVGCAVNFIATYREEDSEEEESSPYEVLARFRLVYELAAGDPIDDADLEQFANWNSVFNAWPYWREYLSSTLNRGQLPRFVVPVMGVPRAPEPS